MSKQSRINNIKLGLDLFKIVYNLLTLKKLRATSPPTQLYKEGYEWARWCIVHGKYTAYEIAEQSSYVSFLSYEKEFLLGARDYAEDFMAQEKESGVL